MIKVNITHLTNEAGELGMLEEFGQDVALEAFGPENAKGAAMIIPSHDIAEIGRGQDYRRQ